jgi:phage terminase small subunit
LAESKKPVPENSKWEQFAQLIVKGVSATKAYVSAGYSPKGVRQSAARMPLNAVVCSRIRELQEAISAALA